MNANRLEAFSDGVMAVLITIMVLDLKTPQGAGFSALKHTVPGFLIYALSFQLIGTYWNNHHHLLHNVKEITGGVMWANLLLLFNLSLVPFFTRWLGEHPKAEWPTFMYAVMLCACAVSYTVLVKAISATHEPGSAFLVALGKDIKGKISIAMYLSALVLSLVNHWIADGLIVGVALMWFIPDRRMQSALAISRE